MIRASDGMILFWGYFLVLFMELAVLGLFVPKGGNIKEPIYTYNRIKGRAERMARKLQEIESHDT
jgi:hypothetical protein